MVTIPFFWFFPMLRGRDDEIDLSGNGRQRLLYLTRTLEMEQCVHHDGSPSSAPPPHSVHGHSLLSSTNQHHVPSAMSYQSVASAPTSALVEMLSRIDALEAIPRLQVL